MRPVRLKPHQAGGGPPGPIATDLPIDPTEPAAGSLTSERRLAPEFAFFAGSTLLVQASRFGVSVVAARLLGPFSFGIWNAVSSVLVYGLSAHVGVLNGMNREVPYHSGREDVAKVAEVRRVSLTIGLLSAFVAGLVTLGLSQLPAWGSAVRLALMATALLLLVQQLYQYLQFALKSSIRFDLLSWQQLVLGLVFPIVVIPLTVRFGLTGFIAGQALATAIVAALATRLLPFRLELEWNWAETVRLARIGLPIMTAGILYAFLTTVDRWIVLTLLGTVSLGYYSLAILTMSGLGVLPNVISDQIYPRMAVAFGRQRAYRELVPLIKRQIVLSLAVIAPVIVVIELLLPPLARHFLPAFSPGVEPAQIAALSFAFLGISGGYGNFLNTVGKQVLYLAAQALALVLNALFSILSVKAGWGLDGVALSLVVSYAIYSGVLAYVVFRLVASPEESRLTPRSESRTAAPTARSAPGLGDTLAAWAAANLSAGGLWLAALLTATFGIPGPADRIFGSVKLGRELDASPGAVVSVVDILLVATLAYAIWRLIRRRRPVVWRSHVPILVLFVALIGLATVSLALALGQIPHDQIGAALKGAVIFVRMALIFACVALVVRNPIDLRGIVVGLVLATGALLANGALFTYQHRSLDRLTAGTFGNDLYANLLALIALLLVGFAVLPWTHRYARVVTGLAALGCMAGIAGSATRTAAIVFITGLVVLGVLFRILRLPKQRAIGAWLVALVGAFFVTQALAVVFLRTTALFGLILREASHRQSVPEVETRFTIWRGTLSMVHSHLLFGVGPGQWDFFRHSYNVNFVEFLDAHNGYLNVLADDGVLVLLVYLLIVAFAVWRGYSAFRALVYEGGHTAAYAADKALLGILGLGIAVWLGTDFLNSGVMNLRAQIFYWCLLAISYRAPEIFRSRRKT